MHRRGFLATVIAAPLAHPVDDACMFTVGDGKSKIVRVWPEGDSLCALTADGVVHTADTWEPLGCSVTRECGMCVVTVPTIFGNLRMFRDGLP